MEYLLCWHGLMPPLDFLVAMKISDPTHSSGFYVTVSRCYQLNPDLCQGRKARDFSVWLCDFTIHADSTSYSRLYKRSAMHWVERKYFYTWWILSITCVPEPNIISLTHIFLGELYKARILYLNLSIFHFFSNSPNRLQAYTYLALLSSWFQYVFGIIDITINKNYHFPQGNAHISNYGTK